ncbi:uncharacterized protein L969DRAFT_94399 [Mixia osmundae IAM 14324]|uniref:Uncharacterized protein n=1 Tax=Mixia osmundae (strain CBS 9802 / IAM 14324 / JCM 22182 / KY 12970) TaxID=764103 RepID=G7E3D1_MIXOS|nr:uncharacterized protein L969DRAFT_94399 [Mixia osmundae IAM 14324]KEI39327.1 hypothetical protein L969DRAFT_94399 [Mixia osmundae IAM 14324]GAA97341.1 hypothetical protein E5Q_04019 [Mixia osmundae IAM 14324]
MPISPAWLLPTNIQAELPAQARQTLPGHVFAINGTITSLMCFHLALNSLKQHYDLEQWSAPDSQLDHDDHPTQHAKLPARILIVFPDRADIHVNLVKENESWLSEEGGKGHLRRLLRRIELRFCPTATHYRFFLSSLVLAHTGKANAVPPGLVQIILCNPSAYLDDPEITSASAYGALVALAVNCVAQLSTPDQQVDLAILDTQAHTLDLPVVAPALSSKIPANSPTPSGNRTREPRLPAGNISDHFADWSVSITGDPVAQPSTTPVADGQDGSHLAGTYTISAKACSASAKHADRMTSWRFRLVSDDSELGFGWRNRLRFIKE